MKKVASSVLMVGVLVMFFASCTKDRSELIIGTWEREALYWTISGDPSSSSNGTYGGPMDEIDGASHMTLYFYEDNTGMIIEDYMSVEGSRVLDTIHFTYSINGKSGVITPIDSVCEGETCAGQSYVIQNIKKDALTLYDKVTMRNWWGEGNDRVQEVYHHFKRI